MPSNRGAIFTQYTERERGNSGALIPRYGWDPRLTFALGRGKKEKINVRWCAAVAAATVNPAAAGKQSPLCFSLRAVKIRKGWRD